MKLYYIVMVIQPFEVSGHPLLGTVQIESGGMVGYLPVYESREAAEAEWPGKEILECMETRTKGLINEESRN